MRNVILHYHLFKNAGTSLDEIFKLNFPNQWLSKEFNKTNLKENITQVRNCILSNPNTVVFSSHTAILRNMNMKNINIFPVLFIRHPIDRIVSVYKFERNQNTSNFGSTLARNTSMAGYIETRLSLHNDRQCRNFHAHRLSQIYPNIEERIAAFKTLEMLPFFGLVEEFDKSIQRLSDILNNTFTNFKPYSIEKNVTRDKSLTLDERLSEARNEIGAGCYENLIKNNKLDFEIYNYIKNTY